MARLDTMPHYHIDTDMGVDDGLALLLASHLLGTDVTLSTVFGNVPVETATRNAMIFRALLGRDGCWSIFSGAQQALDGFRRDARHVHGVDGMGGATSDLEADFIASLSARSCVALAAAPKPDIASVVLIGLGPATNIPFLVSWYGHAAIKRIVLMSGAYFDTGNITPSAEYNAHCDPDALRQALSLGIPVTIVPLDLCRKIELTRATIAEYGRLCTNARGRLIAASHMKYMEFCQESDGIDGCNPHDAIAVIAALTPERFFAVQGSVSVDSAPEHRGRTRLTVAKSHVEILTGGRLKWLRDIIVDVLRTEHMAPSMQ